MMSRLRLSSPIREGSQLVISLFGFWKPLIFASWKIFWPFGNAAMLGSLAHRLVVVVVPQFELSRILGCHCKQWSGFWLSLSLEKIFTGRPLILTLPAETVVTLYAVDYPCNRLWRSLILQLANKQKQFGQWMSLRYFIFPSWPRYLIWIKNRFPS